MPKARPLPADPVLAERMERQRATSRRCVARWRQKHPEKARVLSRHVVQLFRRRIAQRKERALY